MSKQAIIAIVLIVIGVAILAYKGITYTTREPILDVPGVVKVEAERQHSVPMAPIVGGVALVGGIAILLIYRKHAA